MAREKGLEPLATFLMVQNPGHDPVREAQNYVNPEKGVADVKESLAGARDIIAEVISEEAEVRKQMREFFSRQGIIQTTVAKGKEIEGEKYRDYFSWSEALSKAPGHRLLAMFRGENEDILKLSIRPDETRALEMLFQRFVRGNGACTEQVSEAVTDGFRRLLAPSMETEIRQEAKKRAKASV